MVDLSCHRRIMALFSAPFKSHINVCHLAEPNLKTYWKGVLRIVFSEFSLAGEEFKSRQWWGWLLTHNLVYPCLSHISLSLTLLSHPLCSLLLLVLTRLLRVQNLPQLDIYTFPTTHMNATKVWQENNWKARNTILSFIRAYYLISVVRRWPDFSQGSWAHSNFLS